MKNNETMTIEEVLASLGIHRTRLKSRIKIGYLSQGVDGQFMRHEVENYKSRLAELRENILNSGRIVTLAHFAEALDVSKATLYRDRDKGLITPSKNRRYAIEANEIRRLLCGEALPPEIVAQNRRNRVEEKKQRQARKLCEAAP